MANDYLSDEKRWLNAVDAMNASRVIPEVNHSLSIFLGLKQ
jgi:hypothetical protein